MKTCLLSWKTLLIAAGVAVAKGKIAAATNHVAFGNFSFNPSSLTINVGDTVVWSNTGGTHTVTGTGSDPFCGNPFVNTCTRTFNTPGTFHYVCIPHQGIGMTGVVIVVAATNVAPQVALTLPTNNASFTAGVGITLQADASDSDGTVTKVEFFEGTTFLGAAATSPFRLTWTNATPGSYALSAKATDNSGATTTSTSVNISVVSGTVSDITLLEPAVNGTNFGFSFATESGVSYTVQFTESLGPIDWQVLTNFVGNGTIKTVTDATAALKRFYRVSVP